MKYFLIILLIILITYVGRGLSRYYIDRHIFFVSCTEFLQHILSNISFEKDKLPTIVRRYKLGCQNKVLVEILSSYEKVISKGESLQIDTRLLKEEEKEKITNILLRLGKADFATEANNIEISINQLKLYEDKARVERDKYSGFYTKMALLLGLALAVLLI